MHKRLLSAAVVAAGAVLLAASAMPASAAGSPVLTLGSVGGTGAATGDALSASLASGTDAFIATTSGGSTGISCPTATLSATVGQNPDSSGNADESVTGLTTTGCTSNISGVTGVNSVTLNNLPYAATVSPGGTVTVSAGSSGTIQATASLETVIGSITCIYTSTGLTGAAHNTGNSLAFSNQEFTLSSGPAVCPMNGFLSATLEPVTDTTQGSQDVFVTPGQS